MKAADLCIVLCNATRWRPTFGACTCRIRPLRAGIIETKHMRRSRPLAFFAIMMTLCFAVSTVCFASPTATMGQHSSEMPSGGCHGHRGPMRSPAHTCCYVGHQVLAATPIASFAAALDAFTTTVVVASPASERDAVIGIPVDSSSSSPPLITVLRI